MNLDTKITCTICGSILLGIIVTESGLCDSCDHVNLKHTENENFLTQVYGYSVTGTTDTSASVLSLDNYLRI